MLTVALVFHSCRNDNLGVGALTVAQVALLRRLAARIGTPLRIVVIDGPGARPPYVDGPDLEIREIPVLRRPQRLLRAMRGADLAVDIGGGDSFSDIYGAKRLSVLMACKLAAHAARIPLVVAPQTVGPFESPRFARLAAMSLRRSALVAARAEPSMRALERMGVTGAVLASDVALRLPFEPPAPAAGPPRVGINVSGLLAQGGYTGRGEFGLRGDYPALMRRIASRLLARPERPEVHLVPHVLTCPEGGREDDMAACREVARDVPGCTLAPAFATPSEAKSYIAGMHLFAGARMHACIAALSAGVPVVPMAYSRKFAGLFGSLGYAHTVDCRSEPPEAVEAAVIRAFEDRAALAPQAARAAGEGRRRLGAYEAALGALMAGLAERRPRA